jgi:TldD protein
MLSNSLLEKILQRSLEGGAGFAEIYLEESGSSAYELLDRKIHSISSGTIRGLGLRLLYGTKVCYGHSSQLDETSLLTLAANLAAARGPGETAASRPLPPSPVPAARRHPALVSGLAVPARERVEMLRYCDTKIRSIDSCLKQVTVRCAEKDQRVWIFNSEGLAAADQRTYSRLSVSAVAEKDGERQTASENPGRHGGYEFFRSLNLDNLCQTVAFRAVTMLHAEYARGGKLPVIIGNGFGGVIFHESCGHLLETESVRKNASIFAGRLDQAIAHPAVTAVDDGTIPGLWGSINLDDEGMPAQRTVLIENGVLKSYLSDRVGSLEVQVPRTGSGRRESYYLAPVARMRNTYIDRGNDQLADMLASIDHGLYAKTMGGGSVNPATGEFNFAVQEAYEITGGKMGKPRRGATLIGQGSEVLHRISMVGGDLDFDAGVCGAASGSVPTTVGQPTIKVDELLVGGR